MIRADRVDSLLSSPETLTWLGGGVIRGFYGNPWTPEGDRKQAETVRAYEDFLLEHRLGPGGEVAAHLSQGKNGYDFKDIDATLITNRRSTTVRSDRNCSSSPSTRWT